MLGEHEGEVMIMQTKKAIEIAVVMALVASLGCSKKVIKPESHFDTAISHYDQGMRELEAGRLDRARWEFERAKGLDPNNPLPYVGLATVEAKLGGSTPKERNKHRDRAMDLVKKALKKDDRCLPAYLARAKIRSWFKKDEDWYKKALEDIEKARKIDPRAGSVPFTEGLVHEAAYQLDAGEKAFSHVLELKNGFEEQANHHLEKIHKIKRAAPGTKIGIKIGLVDKITRAESAVLLIEELKLESLLQKRTKKKYDTSFEPPADKRELKAERVVRMPEATDIADHWARNYIETIMKLKIRGLEPYPDHTFRPDEHLTRGEYALIIEDLLIKLLGDEGIATKFIGQPSPFPDVGAAHPAFNAINVCVDRGIMKTDLKDNAFHPNETVSGADALLMIKALQDQLRTVF